jgi:hypothetical protein
MSEPSEYKIVMPHAKYFDLPDKLNGIAGKLAPIMKFSLPSSSS